MTSTDRAFIAALQRASVRGPSPAAPLGGPHYATAAPPAPRGAAPLSEHLARRRTPSPEPAPAVAEGPFSAGLEIEAFSWPAVVQQLAHAGREELLGLLSDLAHRTPEGAPVVAIVGARSGVGATTLLLALAKVVGGIGGTTAILDLSGAAGAAAQLGVRRHGGASPSIDDLAVASREDLASVISLGARVTEDTVRTACERLAASHDLVLIDAGDASTGSQLLGAQTQVVIADSTPSGADAIAAVQSLLDGLDIVGVVETLAPIA